MSTTKNPIGFVEANFDSSENFKSMWSQASDPVFGNEAIPKMLLASLVPVQPFEHSADHLFPSSAASIPGLTRFLPSPTSKEGWVSGSRGANCYDESGRMFSSHKNGCLPAFLYKRVLSFY